jgi:hypothetical protein
MARGTSANDGKPSDRARKTTSKATKGTAPKKAGVAPAGKSAKATDKEPAKASGKGTTAKATAKPSTKPTTKGPGKAPGNASAKTSGKTAEASDNAPMTKGARRTAAIRQWSTRRGRAAQLLVRSLATLLLSLCAVEILRLTLTPSPLSVGIAHANLHPFATVRLYLRYGSLRQQALQIGGNAAIGVPLGFLLPQITPRLRGLLRVILVTCAFVTLIELAQWMFVRGRAFDVDDIILAALGACVGYVPLGRMFGMRLHPDHLHWWQRLLHQGGASRNRRTGNQGPATASGSKRRVRSRVHSGPLAVRSRRTAAATPTATAATTAATTATAARSTGCRPG